MNVDLMQVIEKKLADVTATLKEEVTLCVLEEIIATLQARVDQLKNTHTSH